MKCPICQQDEWIEGKLPALNVSQVFVPDRHKFLVSHYPRIAAQACGSCGYLLLSVDVESLKGAMEE